MSETAFATRRFSIAFNLGYPSGAGVRAGVSLLPELGIEARASTLILYQDYGLDLVYRPLASRYNVTPTLRAGMAARQNNLSSWGGPAWIPVPSTGAGVEWRAQGGFFLGGDLGIAVPITPGDGATLPTTAKVTPNVNFYLGGTF
ncbi:MAG: hypothetical protein IT381_04955 [Deltaproteobacteria bacterium]|nr:hypothetical protein [Deltaproteobacteria bacterium]